MAVCGKMDSNLLSAAWLASIKKIRMTDEEWAEAYKHGVEICEWHNCIMYTRQCNCKKPAVPLVRKKKK